MQFEEYCEIILENGVTQGYTIVTYVNGGAVQHKINDQRGIGAIIAQLTHEGWVFAFKDVAGHREHIFFKRLLQTLS